MNVVIFSKESCPYCVRAVDLLTKKNIEFTEHKLDKDFTRAEIIEQFPDARTYPIVVVDQKWIGGYNELLKMQTNGGLR